MMRLPRAAVLLILVCSGAAAQTPKVFPPPARTGWKPAGCRTVPASAPAIASHAAWRSLHSDEVNTDEVSIAYAPMFEADWVAEPFTWNPTGPVFDSAGNLYFVPFRPYEPVALISLDPTDGTRRFAIPNTTGAPVGAGTPLVLADPEHPGAEIVYVGLHDRAFAVRTDGTMVWDVPTGLSGTGAPVFGVNYHPGADAIVGLTGDGFIYALDRRTGAPTLATPFQLPGDRSPPGTPLAAPPATQTCAQGELAQLADIGSSPIGAIIDVLLGNNVEVANYFSIDAATGRLWVAATAPDGEDGTVDGVSSLGALYELDLIPNGPLFEVVEACHRSFVGGSASTPALPRDGSRVYVGDNVGNLLAIDRSCNEIWSVPVGGQITGSVGVAADNGEVYASTNTAIHQVIDHGATAEIRWTANLDVYDLPSGQRVFNQDLAGIGANGIAFQAGAGILFGATPLSITTGAGLLDRDTGQVRWFTPGLDETVAVMSTGPDGALYLGNSPIRRLFTHCLHQAGILFTMPVDPPIGGIRKYRPVRPELTLRDAACAASDRVRAAAITRRQCPDSAAADRTQLAELARQAGRAANDALASGAIDARAEATIDRRLARAQARLTAGRLPQGTFRGLCQRAERVARP